MTCANKTIHRQMTIEEILSLFPHKAQKLSQEITNAGLHCIGCGAATWETLEAGMYSHGLNDAQVDELVKRLHALLAEQADMTTVTLTKAAAAKYLEILEAEDKVGFGLRLSEQAAGCSGFEYILDYSEKALPTDDIFTSNGIEVHINKKLTPRFLGTEVDYVTGLNGSGFKITNPNVRSSCGCGSSYNY